MTPARHTAGRDRDSARHRRPLPHRLLMLALVACGLVACGRDAVTARDETDEQITRALDLIVSADGLPGPHYADGVAVLERAQDPTSLRALVTHLDDHRRTVLTVTLKTDRFTIGEYLRVLLVDWITDEPHEHLVPHRRPYLDTPAAIRAFLAGCGWDLHRAQQQAFALDVAAHAIGPAPAAQSAFVVERRANRSQLLVWRDGHVVRIDLAGDDVLYGLGRRRLVLVAAAGAGSTVTVVDRATGARTLQVASPEPMVHPMLSPAGWLRLDEAEAIACLPAPLTPDVARPPAFTVIDLATGARTERPSVIRAPAGMRINVGTAVPFAGRLLTASDGSIHDENAGPAPIASSRGCLLVGAHGVWLAEAILGGAITVRPLLDARGALLDAPPLAQIDIRDELGKSTVVTDRAGHDHLLLVASEDHGAVLRLVDLDLVGGAVAWHRLPIAASSWAPAGPEVIDLLNDAGHLWRWSFTDGALEEIASVGSADEPDGLVVRTLIAANVVLPATTP